MEYSQKKSWGKGWLIVLLFLPVTLPIISAAQIQGTIHDGKNLPLSFANVILINQKDSSMVTGIMASDAGTFSINNFSPGKYLIKTSIIGYKTTFSDPFEIKTSNDHIHVNPIIVEEEEKLLGEVNVVAKKPIYEQQIDRLVVNVENSITSSGITALEILEKSPGVIVDRQNRTLTLGGKEGVLVMINGKESRIPIAAAIDMLNGMSSENIKKIELMTTPPSKYEAEGDAGIINIVLKKDDDFGTNGTYTLGAGMGIDGKLTGSMIINHHLKKFNYFGMYSYSYDNTYQIWNAYRRFNQNGSIYETNSESTREPVVIFQNSRLGFDYTISSKTVLGVLFTGYTRDWKNEAFNNIYYKKDNQLTNLIDQHVIGTSLWSNFTGNINLHHFFKKDEFLEFNADYLYYYNTNPSNYIIDYHDDTGTFISAEEISVTKKTPINTYVAKLDYTRNFGEKAKLESGLKFTNASFENDVSLANLLAGAWTFDDEFTNKYNLSENIIAAYTSMDYKFNKNTSAKVGLRYEYTNTVLNTETEHGIIDRHYGKLFPTLFLSRDLNKSCSLQLSYSQRITRPTFNELAPFVLFQTPNSYVAGNDKLESSIADILKIDYKFKTIIISLTKSVEKKAIRSYQPGIDQEKNIQFLTSRNLDHVGTLSLVISFPLKLTRWWNMQNNFSGISQNIRTDYDGEKLDITRENFRINAINNFKIFKRITGEFSGYFQSASSNGINKTKSLSSFSAGIQATSKNEKSKLSVNLSDVLKGYNWSAEAIIPELNIHSSDYFKNDSRVLRITYSHNFGSEKIKAARKRETGSEEERKRVE